MRSVFALVLILLLNSSLVTCAETAAAFNLDIWSVRDLVGDLSKENFADREAATRRLIALGSAVLPEIADVSEGAHLDAETRERLDRVSRDAEFAGLDSVSAACSEYERLSHEIATLDPNVYASRIEQCRVRADRVLQRIDTLVTPEERNHVLAELLSNSGARLFRSRYCDVQSPALKFAINDLQLALFCFDRVLQRNPRDTHAEEGQHRTATLLGSARWMESPRFE